MSNLFTKELKGIITTEDYEYPVEVTISNDRTDVVNGEFVVVSYFSEQFCKTFEWTLNEEPTADEVAGMISKREGRTVIF